MAGTARERAAALGAAATIDELLSAGLRDRDYENLPTGERLRAFAAPAAAEATCGGAAVAPASGDTKLIVCDCADVEPEIEINRFLLASCAAEIVDGALAAAFAVAAAAVHFHVAETDESGAHALGRALGEAGHTPATPAAPGAGRGATEPPAGDLPEMRVVRGPFRRKMKGYEDVPTLVLTAETALAAGCVLAGGGEAFRASGMPASAGTKFFQLSGAVNRPGIYELPLGISVRRLIDEAGGGLREGAQLKAVIVGGVKGACYLPDEIDSALDFDAVRQMGGVMGTGRVVVLTERDCIVDHVKRAIGSSCYATCGACSLGREGSYQLREIMADMTTGKGRPNDLDMIRELAGAMRRACACPAGKTAPNIIVSTLEKFPEEYDAHLRRKKCEALVCEKYVTFHILPDLCDGCGACVEECPEEAIAGGRKKIHVIDQDSCEKCGRCLEICSELRNAVVKAGTIKPKTPKRPIPVGSWEA